MTSPVVGEITDETNAAQAFALLPLFFAIGGIVSHPCIAVIVAVDPDPFSKIGPAIGGYLPRPAERFPHLFGNSALFREFPYLLPCLAAAR